MSVAPDCGFEGENSLKVEGRGRFDVRVEANQNICAVNSAVTLVSSFAGWDLVEEVQPWNKPPTGGPEALDCGFVGPMKSRRWSMYVFWHGIILVLINICSS